MALDVNALLNSMVTAASTSLGASWSTVRDYATAQFKQTAATLVWIEQKKLANSITSDEAESLLELQKIATEEVMLAIDTMTVVAVENAINAALGAVKEVVNGALGWTLL